MWRIELLCFVTLLPGLWCQVSYRLDYMAQDDWTGECNTGKRQSPILIQPETIKNDPSLKPLLFHKYDAEFKASIANGGRSLDITLVDDHTGGEGRSGLPMVYAGAEERDAFLFDNVHIHWGTSNNFGSEHRIGDTQYAGEIHLVHFNTKFHDVADAVASGQKNALLVVTFFFKFTSSKHTNLKWDEIFDLIGPDLLAEGGTTFIPEPLKLNDLLPSSMLMPSPTAQDFYQYEGSLTTEGCAEVVSFYIYDKTVPITAEHLKWLRVIRTGGSDGYQYSMTPNYRFTQPLNYRKVRARKSYDTAPQHNRVDAHQGGQGGHGAPRPQPTANNQREPYDLNEVVRKEPYDHKEAHQHNPVEARHRSQGGPRPPHHPQPTAHVHKELYDHKEAHQRKEPYDHKEASLHKGIYEQKKPAVP